MEKPKYQNYRVCYEKGISVAGNEIYELQKICKCSDCLTRRRKGKRETLNAATATTSDISKVDEVAEFLEKWTCEDGKRALATVYFQF